MNVDYLEANQLSTKIVDNNEDEDSRSRTCYHIPSFDEFDMKSYRESLGMTQKEFAKTHDINIATLRKWERSASDPIFGDDFKKILSSWLNIKIRSNMSQPKISE